MIARIKKNDTVQVISGKHKGKQGPVIALSSKKKTVVVQGIAIVTKHVKTRRAGEPGSIRKEERSINIACVMPVCSSCKKPARINIKGLDTGKTVRICNRCKEIF